MFMKTARGVSFNALLSLAVGSVLLGVGAVVVAAAARVVEEIDSVCENLCHEVSYSVLVILSVSDFSLNSYKTAFLNESLYE